MKAPHHPEREAISLSAVLYALSDPTRFQIVQSLARSGEQACGTFGLPVAKPNMSYHIKVLREAGLLRQRIEGTQRINCLRREDIEARFPGLLDTVLRAGAAPYPTDRTKEPVPAGTAGP